MIIRSFIYSHFCIMIALQAYILCKSGYSDAGYSTVNSSAKTIDVMIDADRSGASVVKTKANAVSLQNSNTSMKMRSILLASR